MNIINTARMDTGEKCVKGLKRGEEFPPHFSHFIYTGWNDKIVALKRNTTALF